MSFPRYPKYKDSGVEWLGEVPEHWELKRLGFFFRERREKVSDTDFEPLSVTMQGIVPRIETAAKSDDSENRKKVCVGDFVINSRSDRKGSAGVSTLGGSVSLISIVLEPQEAVVGAFVHHLLRSVNFQEEFYRYGKGIVADLWSTNFSEMRNIRLAVPPLPEQTEIASFLDRETSKIDGLVGEQRRLIELLKEKRQAVISHAVTKGLNPHAPLKPSGIEWLGDVPEHWNVTKVGYVASVARGTGYQNVEEVDQDDGAIQMIRISDFNDFDPVWVRNSSILDGFKVASTDLLMAGTGASAGITMRVTDAMAGMIHSYNAPRIRCLHVEPQFLYFVLNSQGIHHQEDLLFTGSAQHFLDINSISKLEFLCCSQHEQKQIVDYLGERLKELDALTAEAERGIELLQERRTALISAAVTGQIDVRNFGQSDPSAYG